jgi:hypothetical protein
MPEQETIRKRCREGWPKKRMPRVMPGICRRGPGAREGEGAEGDRALWQAFFGTY